MYSQMNCLIENDSIMALSKIHYLSALIVLSCAIGFFVLIHVTFFFTTCLNSKQVPLRIGEMHFLRQQLMSNFRPCDAS